MDIVCLRGENNDAIVNIEQKIKKHSEGFEWGYGGSGPADLALNILCLYISREEAEENGLYQEFKRDFIVKISRGGGYNKARGYY